MLSIVRVSARQPPVLLDGHRAPSRRADALAPERGVDHRLLHPELLRARRFLTDRSLVHSGHACTRRGKRQYCQLYRPLALKGISQHARRPAESDVDPSIRISAPYYEFRLRTLEERRAAIAMRSRKRGTGRNVPGGRASYRKLKARVAKYEMMLRKIIKIYALREYISYSKDRDEQLTIARNSDSTPNSRDGKESFECFQLGARFFFFFFPLAVGTFDPL